MEPMVGIWEPRFPAVFFRWHLLRLCQFGSLSREMHDAVEASGLGHLLAETNP